MYGLSADAIISVLRHLLTFIGGIIVARGWIDAETATQIVGGMITVIGGLLAIFFHAASNGTIPTLSTESNMKQVTQTTTTEVAKTNEVPKL